MIDYGQDVIYIDAPWGGKEYKKSNNISLYLSGMEISEFYSKYLDRASLFIFKVPLNYKISNFENAGISLINVKKEEFILGDKPMYLFLIINGNPPKKSLEKEIDGMEDSNYLVGGTNEIKFLNSSLEQLYNSLSPNNQNKIRSLNDNNKINEVLTIINNKMTGGIGINGLEENTLVKNFNILPEDIKYDTLGKAYEEMSEKFKQTSKELSEDFKIKSQEKKDDIPEEFKIKNMIYNSSSSDTNENKNENKNENENENKNNTKNVSFEIK